MYLIYYCQVFLVLTDMKRSPWLEELTIFKQKTIRKKGPLHQSEVNLSRDTLSSANEEVSPEGYSDLFLTALEETLSLFGERVLKD